MIARKKAAPNMLNLNLLEHDTEPKYSANVSGPAPMEIDAVRANFRSPTTPAMNPALGTPHP